MLDESLRGTGKIVAITNEREYVFSLAVHETTGRRYLTIDEYSHDIRNIWVRPNMDVYVLRMV